MTYDEMDRDAEKAAQDAAEIMRGAIGSLPKHTTKFCERIYNELHEVRTAATLRAKEDGIPYFDAMHAVGVALALEVNAHQTCLKFTEKLNEQLRGRK